MHRAYVTRCVTSVTGNGVRVRLCHACTARMWHDCVTSVTGNGVRVRLCHACTVCMWHAVWRLWQVMEYEYDSVTHALRVCDTTVWRLWQVMEYEYDSVTHALRVCDTTVWRLWQVMEYEYDSVTHALCVCDTTVMSVTGNGVRVRLCHACTARMWHDCVTSVTGNGVRVRLCNGSVVPAKLSEKLQAADWRLLLQLHYRRRRVWQTCTAWRVLELRYVERLSGKYRLTFRLVLDCRC